MTLEVEALDADRGAQAEDGAADGQRGEALRDQAKRGEGGRGEAGRLTAVSARLPPSA
jgi:hypothetical protein